MKRFLLLYLSFKPSKLFFATRSGKNFMTLFLNRVLFVCTSSLSSQPWGGGGGRSWWEKVEGASGAEERNSLAKDANSIRDPGFFATNCTL